MADKQGPSMIVIFIATIERSSFTVQFLRNHCGYDLIPYLYLSKKIRSCSFFVLILDLAKIDRARPDLNEECHFLGGDLFPTPNVCFISARGILEERSTTVEEGDKRFRKGTNVSMDRRHTDYLVCGSTSI